MSYCPVHKYIQETIIYASHKQQPFPIVNWLDHTVGLGWLGFKTEFRMKPVIAFSANQCIFVQWHTK